MGNILGIDVGTNSLGWAIVERTEGSKSLFMKGVNIFQEGVKYEKGIEQSRAAERTKYRSARKLIRRRRVRKINLLEKLVEYGYCPYLSPETLQNWRNRKKYPLCEQFLQWQRTYEDGNKNPYYYRYLAVTRKLDLNTESERFILGRALYHLAQRRGFKSNRLETSPESEGEVKKNITALSEEIQNAGCHYLGEYFYHCYLSKQKIRKRYTAREEHYLKEFRAICEKQELATQQREELEKAIFSQRPLKSQKGNIGKCVFEKNKQRCPTSHPCYEEYRLLCFLNNIRIQKPADSRMRPLNPEERATVLPLFYRKTKGTFDFEDIAKKLAPKKQYKFYKDRFFPESDTLFNYRMDATVSGCPTIAHFRNLWGEEWKENIIANYQKTKNKNGTKSPQEIINDVWHVLFTFDSDAKLMEFGKNQLGLSEEQAKQFSNIALAQDHASLSLKAINNVLPWLRKGFIYSHAIFLANLHKVVPTEKWNSPENQEKICNAIDHLIDNQRNHTDLIKIVNSLIKNCKDNHYSWEETSTLQADCFRKDCTQKIIAYYGENHWKELSEETRQEITEKVFHLFRQQMQNNLNRGTFLQPQRIDERICEYLIDQYQANEESICKLYHPSDIETYKQADIREDGKRFLGSPRIASIKNPMAMRSLFRLRKLINELLVNGYIDEDTEVHIELSRELNDSNQRIAIQQWQKQREKERNLYKEEIRKLFQAECGRNIEPSENDLLKFQLWKEQNGICLYTGEKISLSEFLGANPAYDLEHTIPQSRSYDNSQINLTLCNSQFNRDVKRNKTPYELPMHKDILPRIESWKERYENLEKQIESWRRKSKNALTKASKDDAIQRRHQLSMERDYWKGKYKRFTMKDVPEGFKNSQLVDNGIISKYACQYLKTIFNKVHTVKGSTVAQFRKIWGIQDEYEKKSRSNHIHHCIDAITMACMSKRDYDLLAHLFYEDELYKKQLGGRPQEFPKPWEDFTKDILHIQNEVLISHYTPDVLPKQSRKYLRERGKIIRDNSGKPLVAQGDTVRGSLHMETNYGAIQRTFTNAEGQVEEKICYVVRKPIDSLTAADIKNIVDETVRQKVQNTLDQKGDLKDGVWMNKEKNIPIKSVRCYVPSVTNPIKLKPHRDLSGKEYKQYNYVANDFNYLMAIYEYKDENEKIKRSFELVNNLEAGQYFKQSNSNRGTLDIVPPLLKKGKQTLQRKAILKTGTMVLFYQYTPEEIWELEPEVLSKRLYKCILLSKDGRIKFKFHQEARNDENLKTDYEKEHGTKAPLWLTNGMSNINFTHPVPKLLLSPSSFDMLVEGFDFRIDILGKIHPI